jgi:two-component system, LytTR family, response regulator
MKIDTMIKCLVLDDEPLAANLLAQYIQQSKGIELVLKTTHEKEALKIVMEGGVDVIFLDIQMPEISGIEILKIIRSNCRVILTTAYPEYALEGFEHDVVDYLLKPITYERFCIAVAKVKDRLLTKKENSLETPDHIFIKSGHRICRIGLNSILYIEALRDYVAFYTTNEKILSLESLKNLEEILPSQLFIRIHKSYIINKSKIDFVEKWKVIISQQYLPVGETYRGKLIEELNLPSN